MNHSFIRHKISTWGHIFAGLIFFIVGGAGFFVAILNVLLCGAWFQSQPGILRKLTLGAALTYALTTFFSVLGYYLGTPMPYWLLLMLVSITAIGFLALTPKEVLALYRQGTREDAWGTLVFLSGLALFLPTWLNYGYGTRIPMVMGGEDLMSHFDLFKGIYNERGSLLYYRTDVSDRVFAPLLNYPQGLHANLALWFAALVGGPPDAPTRMMSFFALANAALFAGLGLLIFLVTSSLVPERARSTSLMLVALPFVVLLGLAGGLGALLDLGFYTQITSYALLLTLFLIAQGYSTRSQVETPPLPYLLAMVLVEASVGSTWYMVTPISFAFLAFHLWGIFSARRGLYALLVCASLVLNFFYLLPTLGQLAHAIGSVLNFGGAVEPVPIWIFVSLSLCSVGCLFTDSRERDSTLSSISILVLLALAIIAALYVYQMTTLSRVTYFFFKSHYLLLLVLLCTGCAGLITMTYRLLSWARAPDTASLFATTLLSILLVTETYPSLAKYPDIFFQGNRPFLDRESYARLIALHEKYRAADVAIYPILEHPVGSHFTWRWLPLLVENKNALGFFIPALSLGEKYPHAVVEAIQSSAAGRKIVVYDPQGYLAKSCRRRFFFWHSQGKITIEPEAHAQWPAACGNNTRGESDS